MSRGGKRVVPTTDVRFRRSREAFETFLRERGSEIRATTNAYELLRFTTPEGVGVVYCNSAGKITSWFGGSYEAYKAFIHNAPWRVGTATKRKGGRTVDEQRVAALIARDGDECWFCGEPFEAEGPKARTKEHLVSVTQKGPDTLVNLVLAHFACNREAENLSVSEKVKLRERKRTVVHGPSGAPIIFDPAALACRTQSPEGATT